MPAEHALRAALSNRPANGLGAIASAVLHGLRYWLAASLALWVAFTLQLSAPYWAATSAGIVCLPGLGASIRKARARIVGTIAGTIFIFLLTACFPQDRVAFLFGLAVWCAASGFLATLFDNSSSYGAALAGYTAVIVASTIIDSPGLVFQEGVSRASEITVGIVCATAVLMATSRGHAVKGLADALAAILAETASGTLATLRRAGSAQADTRPARRELIKRAAATSPQPRCNAGSRGHSRRYPSGGRSPATCGACRRPKHA